MKRAHIRTTRSFAPVMRLVLVVGLTVARTSAADTLDGPSQVVAAADGSFSYTAVFTAGDAGTLLAYWEAYGGANTDYDWWIADAFCAEPLDPGEQIVELIEGSLIDPTQPGSATVHFVDCSDNELTLETTILPPPAPVPALSPRALGITAALLFAIALAGLAVQRGAGRCSA